METITIEGNYKVYVNYKEENYTPEEWDITHYDAEGKLEGNYYCFVLISQIIQNIIKQSGI